MKYRAIDSLETPILGTAKYTCLCKRQTKFTGLLGVRQVYTILAGKHIKQRENNLPVRNCPSCGLPALVNRMELEVDQ